jgi:hypothetical protein
VPAFPPLFSLLAALAVHDDGGGSALYIGGETLVASTWVGRIWRWNGNVLTVFTQLGADDTVLALAEFDDGSGSGPVLYVGSLLGIRRWNGSALEEFGGGVNGAVRALLVHDDGSGPALYAGGEFSMAGGLPAQRIARWDGSTWSSLGAGLLDDVHSLASHDDGSGSGLALYAGTDTAIERWNGSAWANVGSMDTVGGSSVPSPQVFALASYASGAGLSLYAGGVFTDSPADDAFFARFGCPPNPADVDGNGVVESADLEEILVHWGPCPEPCHGATCPWDTDHNCDTGFNDLVVALLNWG